jgi:hypothetical protein
MSGRLGIVLGFIAAAAPSAAWAGAWTMDEGHGQVVVGGLLSDATDAFSGSRSLQSTPRYGKFEAQGLIEYGVTDRFTLMAAPGFQRIDIAPPTSATRSGAGYTEFGGRYRLWQDNGWVFSTQATARVPGTNETSNPAAIGYTDPEYDARALLGKSFTLGGLAAFVDFEAAQRFRTGAPPNEFRFDASLGVRVAPKWLLLAQSLNVMSEGSGGLLFPAYDYSKVQLSVVYSLTPAWSLQFGGFSTVSGRNALQENGLIAGVWYKF